MKRRDPHDPMRLALHDLEAALDHLRAALLSSLPGRLVERLIARIDRIRARRSLSLFDTGYVQVGNWMVHIDLLRDAAYYRMLADATDLTLDEFLDWLERWSAGPGLPYGITVERDLTQQPNAPKTPQNGGPRDR